MARYSEIKQLIMGDLQPVVHGSVPCTREKLLGTESWALEIPILARKQQQQQWAGLQNYNSHNDDKMMSAVDEANG